MDSEGILGLAQCEITKIDGEGGTARISARYTGPVACPDCSSEQLRSKGRYLRTVRHETWGMRHFLIPEAHKWLCRTCGRYFRQQFPGILKWQRATEKIPEDDLLPPLGRDQPAPAESARRHRRCHRGTLVPTVLQRLASARTNSLYPAVLGIDEHFFSRRHGYATTFCDSQKPPGLRCGAGPQ